MGSAKENCEGDLVEDSYGEILPEEEVRKWLGQNSEVLAMYDLLMVNLQKRTITSSYSCADETAKLLTRIIEEFSLQNLEIVFKNFRSMGFYLLKQQPMALCIMNVILRFISVLCSQIDELDPDGKNRFKNPSLDTTLYKIHHKNYMNSLKDINEEEYKETILEVVEEEIIHDINYAYEGIQKKTDTYINNHDTIMIHGESHTVTQLLISLNKTKHIHIIQCESAPLHNGHKSAHILCKNNIKTTLIPDANIYAVMKQVDKVILPAHTVLANGGVLCQSGAYLLAMAARYYRIPVIVLSGMYKLCPIYTNDQHQFNDINSPQTVLPFAKRNEDLIKTNIINPIYDYIPPEYINIIITSNGEYPPSAIFRLIRESYTLRDVLYPIYIQNDL
ncbi:hypothetical protein WA158_004863 [Blastocystis sp. Blastoise]